MAKRITTGSGLTIGLVLAVAGTLFGMGYALLSQVTQPWQLFALFGLFIGVGMATHDVVTHHVGSEYGGEAAFHARSPSYTAG